MPIPEKDWEYIGDGVYAGWNGFGVWLHANDHAMPTDKIYLEPGVLKSLNDFVNYRRNIDKQARYAEHYGTGMPDLPGTKHRKEEDED